MAFQDVLALLNNFRLQQSGPQMERGNRIPQLQKLNADEQAAGIPELERLGVMPRAEGDFGGFQGSSPSRAKMMGAPQTFYQGQPEPSGVGQNNQTVPFFPVPIPGKSQPSGVQVDQYGGFTGLPKTTNPQPLANQAIPSLSANAGPTISYGPMDQSQNFQPVALPDSFAGQGVRVDAPWRHMDESEQSANARYLGNLKAASEEQASQAQLAHFGQQSQYQNANLMQHLMAMQQENALRNKEFGLQQEKFSHQKSVDDFLRSPEGQTKRDIEALMKAQTAQNLTKNVPQIQTDIQNARIASGLGGQQAAGPAGRLGPLLDLLGSPDAKGNLPELFGSQGILTEMYKRGQAQPGLLTNDRLAALSQVLQQMYPAEEYNRILSNQPYPSELLGGAVRAMNPFVSAEEFRTPLQARKFFRESFQKK